MEVPLEIRSLREQPECFGGGRGVLVCPPLTLSHLPTALSCPANSRYELCAPACPATCNSEAAPSNCSGRPCAEGCVCLSGFVASGGACVAASSCGCTYEGRPLAPGEEVWADDQCRRRCTCDGSTQKVTCRDTQGCPQGERCRVENGLRSCYPDNFGSCQGSGDPHYVSFDGRRFDFMGTCTYLLVGSCGQDAALPTFRVLVENEHRGSQTVSYTRAVRVEARGVEVALRREYKGQVLVSHESALYPRLVAPDLGWGWRSVKRSCELGQVASLPSQ